MSCWSSRANGALKAIAATKVAAGADDDAAVVVVVVDHLACAADAVKRSPSAEAKCVDRR